MSKAPKKAAAPASAAAPKASAPTKPAAKPPKKADDAPKAPKTPIDEAIEIALASASTAVDSAQEIQRLRGEVQRHISGANRNNKILFYATIMILAFSCIGVFGSLIFFKRAYNEFEAVAKVNREALAVFAGEINGLVAASKHIDDALKATGQSLVQNAVVQDDLKKSIQALKSSQEAMASKMQAPATVNYDKSFAAIQKGLDDLVAANRAMATRISELQVKQSAPPAPAPAARAAPKPRPAATPATSARAAQAGREREMIRYP